MHDLRMIHTDLKPENILLVSGDYVKVHDYKVLLFCFICGFLFENMVLFLRRIGLTILGSGFSSLI